MVVLPGGPPGVGPPGGGPARPPVVALAAASPVRNEMKPSKLLTDAQKSKWKELQGDRFAFPQQRGRRAGFGPMGGPERKLVKQFDTNKDGWLNAEERAPARVEAKKGGGGRGGFGPPGGFGRRSVVVARGRAWRPRWWTWRSVVVADLEPFGGENVATSPGPTIKKEDVAPVSGGSL